MNHSENQLVVTDSGNSDRLAVLENENEIQAALPSYFQPAFDELSNRGKNLLQKLSSSIPDVLLAVQTAGGGTVYKAVNDIALQQTKDGLYSAALRDSNGQIKKHVSLEKVSSGAARSFSFAYSALNAVVGQANMMSIDRQLKSITASLKESKDREYILQISKIEAACVGLQKVFFLENGDHRAQTILERQNDLLGALIALGGFMRLEIEQMPTREMSTWESLFSGWIDSSPVTKDAEKHFQYFLKAFQPWFNGMRWLILSDALLNSVTDHRSVSGFKDAFIKELQGIIVDSGLPHRIEFIPKYDDWDPIDFIRQFDVQEIKKALDLLPTTASDSLEIVFKAS